MNESYKWVTSQTRTVILAQLNVLVFSWLRHAKPTTESHINKLYKWLTSQTRRVILAQPNTLAFLWMSHVTQKWVTSAYISYERIMLHKNESCHRLAEYSWLSQAFTIQCKITNESCHPYVSHVSLRWVMSQTRRVLMSLPSLVAFSIQYKMFPVLVFFLRDLQVRQRERVSEREIWGGWN